jgi:hypothetical protein
VAHGEEDRSAWLEGELAAVVEASRRAHGG